MRQAGRHRPEARNRERGASHDWRPPRESPPWPKTSRPRHGRGRSQGLLRSMCPSPVCSSSGDCEVTAGETVSARSAASPFFSALLLSPSANCVPIRRGTHEERSSQKGRGGSKRVRSSRLSDALVGDDELRSLVAKPLEHSDEHCQRGRVDERHVGQVQDGPRAPQRRVGHQRPRPEHQRVLAERCSSRRRTLQMGPAP